MNKVAIRKQETRSKQGVGKDPDSMEVIYRMFNGFHPPDRPYVEHCTEKLVHFCIACQGWDGTLKNADRQ